MGRLPLSVPKRDHAAEHLRRTYNLTDADYNRMLASQEGRCAICGEYRKLAVDHCHATDKVRGLLCNACNSILGFANDNQETLKNALAYLERTG